MKRFDIPEVVCNLNGITVKFEQKGSLKTQLVVKDHLNDSECEKMYDAGENSGNFSVTYGTCGVDIKNKTAELTLMVLRPPGEIRESAQTRLIKCEYPTKEGIANKSYQVGDLRTVTDLPSTTFSDEDPTHELVILNSDNKRVTETEPVTPGTPLIGKLRISPKSYFGSIKNCYLAPDQKDDSKQYKIIDESGCPVDSYVNGWHWDTETNSVQLHFKAFKLLDWNQNHIFCDVHYCIKESDCAPVS